MGFFVGCCNFSGSTAVVVGAHVKNKNIRNSIIKVADFGKERLAMLCTFFVIITIICFYYYHYYKLCRRVIYMEYNGTHTLYNRITKFIISCGFVLV